MSVYVCVLMPLKFPPTNMQLPSSRPTHSFIPTAMGNCSPFLIIPEFKNVFLRQEIHATIKNISSASPLIYGLMSCLLQWRTLSPRRCLGKGFYNFYKKYLTFSELEFYCYQRYKSTQVNSYKSKRVANVPSWTNL